MKESLAFMKAVPLLVAFAFPALLACSGQLAETSGPADLEPAIAEPAPILAEAPPIAPAPILPQAQVEQKAPLAHSGPVPRLEGPAPPPVTTARIAGPASNDEQRLARVASERTNLQPRGNYQIGPGDLVEINVFDLAEMNRKERVSSSGFIQMPLIGAIQAVGKTESDLAADIAARLSVNYLQNPQVNVSVIGYKSQQVAVTGAVARPGLYPLTRERYTLLDMLSEAGGRTRDSGSIVLFVPAPSSGTSAAFAAASTGGQIDAPETVGESINVDLERLMQGAARANLSFPLVGGDVIYVPEAGSFSIEGWVEKPGTYPISRHMSALGAISAAGGPLFPALLSEVEILRARDDQTGTRGKLLADLNAVELGEQPDVELRSGDAVRVPGSVPLMIPWGFWELLKNMVRFGASVSTIP